VLVISSAIASATIGVTADGDVAVSAHVVTFTGGLNVSRNATFGDNAIFAGATTTRSALWDWIRFLKGKRKGDFDMIAERNPRIRGAVNTLYRLSEDPEVRARMEYREKARSPVV
jgi:hypothetical protein